MWQPSTGKYCKVLGQWQCPKSGRNIVVQVCFAVSVIKRIFRFRQLICCFDLYLAEISNLHHYILVGRVNTAEVSDKLVNKEVILVPQSSLLRCCSESLGFSFHCIIRICLRRFASSVRSDPDSDLWRICERWERIVDTWSLLRLPLATSAMHTYDR